MGVSRSKEKAGESKVNVEFALILRISEMMGDMVLCRANETMCPDLKLSPNFKLAQIRLPGGVINRTFLRKNATDHSTGMDNF